MSIDLERVKAKVDCRQVLLQHGIDYKGRDISCPMPEHADNHPSFGLCHNNQGYKCHGCDASGDVVALEMVLASVDFKTALATLTKMAGVENVQADPKTDARRMYPTPERCAATQLWSVQQKHSDAKLTLSHDYHKANGDLVARVLRFDWADGKGFRPICKDQDGWRSGDPNGKWPIYRLTEMAGTGAINIFEGEKCADLACGIGLTNCTTSAHGARSAELTDWRKIAGRDVVIFADNDEPGLEYAWNVIRLTKPKTAKIIQFRELPKKADLADWLDERDAIEPDHIHAELRSVVGQAPFVDTTARPDKKQPKTDAKQIKLPPQTPEYLDGYYYAANSKEYVVKNERGRYLARTASPFRRYLKNKGMMAKCAEGETMSEIDRCMLELEEYKDVDYIGPLAGRSSGFYSENGVRFLVTSSPVIIAPSDGDCPTISKMLSSIFSENEVVFIHAWLKVGYEALAAGHLMPGQALAIAGPANCFKSFVQREIFTPILGGRSQRPYQFMSGMSPFNSDLFAAEHLMIEDESASTDIRARRSMGSLIKNFTVNVDQRCHAKGQDAIMLRPFWRLSITMNDEAENLLVLPPIDDSIRDKIIILEAHLHPDPPAASTMAEREILTDTIQYELPAYIQFLLDFEIPDNLKSDRFGVTHYQNKNIMEVLEDSTPETKLMEMIAGEIIGPWSGSSAELQSVLQDRSSGCYDEAKKLLHWYGATGTYLGRLHKKYPHKILVSRKEGGRMWEIL